MTDIRNDIDPELRDDREEVANDFPDIELPEFEEEDFVLPEEFESGDGE